MSERIFVSVAGFALAARSVVGFTPEGRKEDTNRRERNHADDRSDQVDPRYWFPTLR